jgi:hypothetical protein
MTQYLHNLLRVFPPSGCIGEFLLFVKGNIQWPVPSHGDATERDLSKREERFTLKTYWEA